MKFKGVVTRWDETKGYGFITADGGDQPLFFHHSELHRRIARPGIGQRVAFDVATGPKGKRALRIDPVQIAPVRQTHARVKAESATHSSRAPLKPLQTLLPFLAIGLIATVLSILATPPTWAWLAYLVLSAVTYLAYALDKSAARRNAWRIKESTLHLLALLGGWPGAWLAQQQLRHKTRKTAFRLTYWATVMLNVAALTVLSTPWGRQLVNAG